MQKLLLVGFSRWRVERCFEDQKSEIGLDQYEGRRYQGLKRHLILSGVSYLFLSRMREEFGGGKSGLDRVPGAHSDRGLDPVLGGWASAPSVKLLERTAAEIERTQKRNAAALQEPHQGNTKEVAGVRHQAHRSPPLRLGKDLAL